jgi:hypothetical protein
MEPIAKITTNKKLEEEVINSSMRDSVNKSLLKDKTNFSSPGRTTNKIISDMETAMSVVNFKK